MVAEVVGGGGAMARVSGVVGSASGAVWARGECTRSGPVRGTDCVTLVGVVSVVTSAVHDGEGSAPWRHAAYLTVVGEVDMFLSLIFMR